MLVHHVAIIPEAVPVPLLHLFAIERESGVEPVFELLFGGRRTVRQAPDAEDLRGVDILRRSHQQRRLSGDLGLPRQIFIGRDTGAGEERHLAGARHAVRSAEARLHVFIAGIQAVRPGVVVPQVHGGGVGRPQPHVQVGRVARGFLNLERRRVRLPEVLHADGHAARDVADKDQPGSAPSGNRGQPAALRIGAFLDGEAVGRGLHQFVGVPHRPVAEQLLPALVEGLLIGDALARQLVRVGITAAAGQHERPRAGRLDRFGPQPVALARKTHVAIVDLLAHRHRESHAQPVDEVFLVVAVEDDGVYQAHLRQAGVEIQAHGEGQPLARASFSFVNAFDFDHGAHRAGLFHGDLADAAGELRAVVERAHQASMARHHAAFHGHRVDQERTLPWDAALQPPRVDVDGPAAFGHLHRCSGSRRRAPRQFERPRVARAGHGGETDKLHRAVGPIRQRPVL